MGVQCAEPKVLVLHSYLDRWGSAQGLRSKTHGVVPTAGILAGIRTINAYLSSTTVTLIDIRIPTVVLTDLQVLR